MANLSSLIKEVKKILNKDKTPPKRIIEDLKALADLEPNIKDFVHRMKLKGAIESKQSKEELKLKLDIDKINIEIKKIKSEIVKKKKSDNGKLNEKLDKRKKELIKLTKRLNELKDKKIKKNK